MKRFNTTSYFRKPGGSVSTHSHLPSWHMRVCFLCECIFQAWPLRRNTLKAEMLSFVSLILAHSESLDAQPLPRASWWKKLLGKSRHDFETGPKLSFIPSPSPGEFYILDVFNLLHPHCHHPEYSHCHLSSDYLQEPTDWYPYFRLASTPHLGPSLTEQLEYFPDHQSDYTLPWFKP